MEWQPIETAPKDGTVILVFGGSGTWVSCWLKHSQKWAGELNSHPCTHWMPLPEPPEGE